MPLKVIVCKCNQCRLQKRKKKNRKLVKFYKRLCNKKVRTGKEGKVFSFCWA